MATLIYRATGTAIQCEDAQIETLKKFGFVEPEVKADKPKTQARTRKAKANESESK